MSRVIKTTCPYCGVGCGVEVSEAADLSVVVRGDKDHPANFGKLCSKGAALGETLSQEGRFIHPLINEERVEWSTAIEVVAKKFKETVDNYGPDSVAFYVSGQLLTEDYYVANKLTKGFIGTANIDTNSRLCMASSVAGHKRAFGSDTVPGNYEDLELADLIVITGSNLAWCHPVLYQRIVKAKRSRSKTDTPLTVVVIDPRRTATCDVADLHLPINSGSDVALFNGLLSYLDRTDVRDDWFVDKNTNGVDELLQSLDGQDFTTAKVAKYCGLKRDQVEQFYKLFADTRKTVTIYSQGVNQSSSGTDKVNAIINCHLFTGRIGLRGMGPFSVTGQPNAMGGREVGALSNQLACHMDFNNPDHIALVKNFWHAENMAEQPGLKAVDMFEAIEQGKIKAIWIMATNPAVSLPNNAQVRRALELCEFVVVSDGVQNDTTQFADVIFPTHLWGEKSGTVTNSERRISRQRAFIDAPKESLPDWRVICDVAHAMGYEGFDFASQDQIFREYAALSGYNNNGMRDFDIGDLCQISAQDYEDLEPIQWPLIGDESKARLFSDGAFYTPNKKANFVATNFNPPADLASQLYPYVLNTGRVRDHWHTMTRTGLSARLNGHVSESFVELNKIDAATHGIEDGELVRVSSRWGEGVFRAKVTCNQKIGDVFIPMHWNKQFSSDGLVGALVNPFVDSLSGQPEFKHTPVKVKHERMDWHGFLLSRKNIDVSFSEYWNKTWRDGLWHYELAGKSSMSNWAAHARSLLCANDPNPSWGEFVDSKQQNYRGARFIGQRLDACFFVGKRNDLPSRDWLIKLFAKHELEASERSHVLSGIAPSDAVDTGPVVCACFGVGRKAILEQIEQGADTPEKIGKCLNAGTNCGSCVPEIRDLIHDALTPAHSV